MVEILSKKPKMNAEQFFSEYRKDRRDFSGVDFSGAKFSTEVYTGAFGATLKERARVTNMNWSKSIFDGVEFDYMDIRKTNADFSIFENMKISSSNLESFKLRAGSLDNASFTDCTVIRNEWTYTTLRELWFRRVELAGLKLGSTDIRYSHILPNLQAGNNLENKGLETLRFIKPPTKATASQITVLRRHKVKTTHLVPTAIDADAPKQAGLDGLIRS